DSCMVMEGEQPQEDSAQPQPPASCSKKPDKTLYQPKKKQDGPKDKAQTQGDGKPKPRPRYTDKARKNAKNKKDKGGKTGGEGNGVLNGEAKLEERVEGGGEKGPQNDGQAATANQEGDGVVGSRLEGGSESSPEREGGSREGIEEGLQEEEEEEESWDALFDDEGECLDPHVLEERGFDIQFVDDTHALALFNSPIAAREALRTKHPLLKVRSLAKASVTTRAKARSCSDYLLPTKERPQTSAVLARRLVMGALGVKKQKRLAAKQRHERLGREGLTERKGTTYHPPAHPPFTVRTRHTSVPSPLPTYHGGYTAPLPPPYAGQLY
ncbi:unnamed protein product, partial [Coregonus sp. 'balchen']